MGWKEETNKAYKKQIQTDARFFPWYAVSDDELTITERYFKAGAKWGRDYERTLQNDQGEKILDLDGPVGRLLSK